MSNFIIAGNKIFATGDNKKGQLGIGHNRDTNIYQECLFIDPGETHTDEPLNNYPRLSMIDSGEFIMVSNSRSSTIALDSNGFMWVCGSNRYNNLGIADPDELDVFMKVYTGYVIRNIMCGTSYSVAVDDNGTLLFCGIYQLLGLKYPIFPQEGYLNKIIKFEEVETGIRFKSVIGSSDGLIGLDIDGKLYACHKGTRGLFEQIYVNKLFKDIDIYRSIYSIQDTSIFTLDNDGNLFVSKLGPRWNSPLFHLRTPEKCRAISCGDVHTGVIDVNGGIIIFGDHNYHGQLGPDMFASQYPDVDLIWSRPDQQIKFNQICCNGNTTMLLDDTSSVYVTGSNQLGELGIGFQQQNSFGFVRVEFEDATNLACKSDTRQFRNRFMATKRSR